MSTDPYWDLRRIPVLFSDEHEEPSTSFHRYVPHEHKCPVHGRWYHTDPECEERWETPCPGPENHGDSSEEHIR